MPESPRTGRAERPDPLLLLPGLLWSSTLFVAFAFLLRPLPESAGEIAVLIFLTLFLGAVHAGAFAAVAGRLRGEGRPARLASALLALVGGAGYAWWTLSMVKFSATRSHMRFEDLWFLVTSAAQASGEGTPAERLWLAGAALSPFLLAIPIYLLLRVTRRRARGFPLGAAVTLVVAGAAGLAASAWRYPAAKMILATRLPETAAVARTWSSARARELTADWQPDPERQLRLDSATLSSRPKPWNLLVVMLESVSWKRLLGPDARPGSTPRLLALAEQSIRFRRAYATSTHSDYAQTSILGSLYPRKSRGHDYFTDLEYPRALPWDVLAPPDRRTAVFSTQNEGWGNMIAFLRTPRLELLRHAPDFPDAPHRGEGSETKIFEETVVERFLDWLGREPERPFVAYLNFQATHYPYVWPESFEPPFGEAPIDFRTTFLEYPREKTPVMLDRFHNALAYLDLWTGHLVDGLERTGVWDRTVVVVVADHGEAFHEHGLVTHGTTLLEEQLRVPMWIRIPGRPPRVVAEPVSTLDALPAVYRAMGLSRHPAHQGSDEILEPGYSAAGRPLFASLQGMTREDAILLDGWKWIVNLDRREGALFDLADDPGETRNLVLTAPERRQQLDAALAAFLLDQLGYYRSRAWESGWGPPRPAGTR